MVHIPEGYCGNPYDLHVIWGLTHISQRTLIHLFIKFNELYTSNPR